MKSISNGLPLLPKGGVSMLPRLGLHVANYARSKVSEQGCGSHMITRLHSREIWGHMRGPQNKKSTQAETAVPAESEECEKAPFQVEHGPGQVSGVNRRGRGLSLVEGGTRGTSSFIARAAEATKGTCERYLVRTTTRGAICRDKPG